MPKFSGAGGVFRRHNPPTNTDLMPPTARVLLTTSGLATEPLKNAALTLSGKGHRFTSRKDRPIQILVLNDAQRIQDIARFGFINSGVWNHGLNAAAGRFWTRATLRYAFGENAKITKINLNSSTHQEVFRAIANADVVYGGGTVGLVALGVERHKDLLREMIDSGKPVILESAFAMAAGENYLNLEPPDPNPQGVKQNSLGFLEKLRGLGVFPGDVVVHAAGSEGKLEVKLPLWRHPVSSLVGRFGGPLLSGYETPQGVIDEVEREYPKRRRVILPTTGGAQFSEGELTLMGERG